MCIALISTSHPDYHLIVADNRDEYLHRPTSRAHWWDEHPHVLSARDLARPVHGTWLGVTRQGRIAVLTNFREKNTANTASIVGRVSRGEIVGRFLTMEHDTPIEEYAATLKGKDGPLVGSEAGGFSLVFGDVRRPLAVVSNRPSDYEVHDDGTVVHKAAKEESEASDSTADGHCNGSNDIKWIGEGGCETVALSNVAFGDRSWPKVVLGESMMQSAIETSVDSNESEEDLIQRLLAVLTNDSLPRLRDGQGFETYMTLLKESIYIPAIGETGIANGKENEQPPSAEDIRSSYVDAKAEILSADKDASQNGSCNNESDSSAKRPSLPYCRGSYGTQTQTIVLVHKTGRVTYFERRLYDLEGNPIPVGQGDQVFTFDIEE
ncbi:hypothetical protein KEM56_007308 [Ascosphaera pollenicola]|nr:hypothetical protein KEM56_007308 [Ascosphaera pollenicola]